MNARIIFKLVVVVLAWIIALNNADQETAKTNPDFTSVYNQSTFVDKTLLVKALFKEEYKKVVVKAPLRSGRSTMLDMLRRFLEIETDESGSAKTMDTTTNYKLFKEGNFSVSEQEDLFRKHFGQHPVVFVSCKPLQNISLYQEMLRSLRHILGTAYSPHGYLLKNSKLWIDELEKENFRDLLTRRRTYKLSAPVMVRALTYLCEMLTLHFGKPAVVLVDDFDAFVDSPAFKFSPNDGYLIGCFFTKLYTSLLVSKFVDRALLTSVIKEHRSYLTPTSQPVLPRGTVTYNYLDDRPICSFFRSKFP